MKRKAPSLSKVEGFSLLELLLATAIIVIIMAVIASSFLVGINTYERAKKEIEFNRGVRFTLNRITRMLSSAYLPKGKNPEELFQSENEQTLGYDNDEITFLATYSPMRFLAGEVTGGLVEVRYFIEREGGADSGVLSESLNYTYYIEMEDDEEDYEIIQPLLDGLLGLNFRYFDGEEWQDEWDVAEKDEMPKAVEVTLSVIRDGDAFSFTSGAFIPLSNTFE